MAPIRSFSVYIDEPDVDAPPKPVAKPGSEATKNTTSSSTLSENAIPDELITATDCQKENLDPVTGEKAQSIGDKFAAATKKRKASGGDEVLVTKLYKPARGSKKVKLVEVSGSSIEEVAKKTSSSAPSKGKRSKAPKASRTAMKRSRRIAGLPPVAEEAEVEQESMDKQGKEEEDPRAAEREKNTVRSAEMQALIDARCYEFTVLPLANVTAAYEQSSCEHAYGAIKVGRAGRKKPISEIVTSSSGTALSSKALEKVAKNPATTGAPPKTDRDASKIVASGTSSKPAIFSRQMPQTTFTFTAPSRSGERFKRTASAPLLRL